MSLVVDGSVTFRCWTDYDSDEDRTYESDCFRIVCDEWQGPLLFSECPYCEHDHTVEWVDGEWR